MRVIATTSGEMLEALLYHLHETGWRQVDIDKLVTVYVKFAWRANRCVYGGPMVIPNGPMIKASISQEADALVAKGWAQRSVSRVWLTDEGQKQAAMLAFERMLYGSLPIVASETFPPRA